MPESFPIHRIAPDDVSYEEDMGTKDKFWCRVDGDERLWLFKHPRENTGEHWAELIAAELGQALGIKVAEVRLAEYEGVRGSMTRNIRAGADQTIVHGNELLEVLPGYERERRWRQRMHTFDNIRRAIEARCGEEVCSECMRDFCSYLVLDALIGNTDRHHENWALLRTESQGGRTAAYQMCPSFDHASSLGRELLDERRLQLLDDRIDTYRLHKKARSAIYWMEGDKHPMPNLQLLDRVQQNRPECLSAVRDHLSSHDATTHAAILEKMPDGWMSDAQKRFVLAVTHANLQNIIRCLNS